MTHRADVARGRDVVARWCNLAEQRLEYLTELFESGRWRRFHSEVDFLENIQEARIAVDTWRRLLTREASLDNSAIDMSWLGHTQTVLPRAPRPQSQSVRPPSPPGEIVARPLPLPVEIVAKPPPLPVVSISAQPVHVAADEAPSAPAMKAPMLKDFSALPRAPRLQSQPVRHSPPPVEIVARPPPSPPVVSIPTKPVHVAAHAAPSAMKAPMLKDFSALTSDVIAERYPVLRNAL